MTFSSTSAPGSPSAPDLDVLVVGAGITGIHQLLRAREAGFSVQLVEAGSGVGGTWFWNRYPGARFDSESYTYAFLFSRELFDEWEWQEHFAAQPETESYLNHVVDRFDLRRDIRFDSAVTDAVWSDEDRCWRVHLTPTPGSGVTESRDGADGDARTVTARFLVSATGVLSVPYLPEVPGREDFAGEQHHTGRWPAGGVDVRGKRVAVVGTSSSGVQVVPAILDEVESLTVYQRSANWCTPLNNRPITADEQVDLRDGFEALRETLNTSIHGFHHPMNPKASTDDSPEDRQAFFEEMWASPGFRKFTSNYVDILSNPSANAEWCEFIAAKIRAAVHDPATAEQLIPKDHAYGEKRPPYVTGYFEAFNDPKVELVDLRAEPMVRVTGDGIETPASRRHHDVIVWATGFDFGTGALLRMGVVGRDGLTLTEHWAEGPTTFLGIGTHGFPNLFFPGGPHAAAGNNPRYNGDQVDFVTELLEHARDVGAEVVEATTEAEDRWSTMIDRAAEANPFGTIGQYVGGNIPGKPKRYLLNSAGRPKLWKELQRVRDTDFEAFGLAADPGRSEVRARTEP